MEKITQHLPRLNALMDEVSSLIDKIRETEGYGANMVEAGEMWGKIKDKVETLTLLNNAIDTQEAGLKDKSVSESLKSLIRERLGRDLAEVDRKVKSALLAEKKVRVYINEFNNPTSPKDPQETKAPKEETPKRAPEKETPKPAPKPAPKPEVPKPEQPPPQEQKLIDEMGKAVDSFQKGIPEIEQGVYDGLLEEVKNLETQGGKLLNNVQNLRRINVLKNKIERLIVTNGYKTDVKQFIDAFNVVESLQQQYFADFNFKFKPVKTLPIIKEMAVDKTLNDLLGQGLRDNIVDPLHSILTDNITSGGSYASLTRQLSDSITGTDQTEGILQRYARTYTTDAINQYSAQYHEAIAQDLSLNWGRYVGSNLTTTREFCEYLTKKEWVHRSELPTIVSGNIDGHQCRLSKTTELPLGMIAGTNADNFKVRRGGWNCGHQFFWVPDAAVPKEVKALL